MYVYEENFKKVFFFEKNTESKNYTSRYDLFVVIF